MAGLSELDREGLRKAVRSCRVEDGAPVSLIREGDVDHVTYMVGAAVEQIVARHVTAALIEAAEAIVEARPEGARAEEPGNWKRGERHGRLRAANIVRAQIPPPP